MTRAFILCLAALVISAPSARAHSWYPHECCSGHDCMPADSISTDQRGDWFVMVGTTRIWVPQGFAVRPSQDDRIHVCFHIDEFNFPMPMCLFLPTQS